MLNRFLPEIGAAHGAELDNMLNLIHWLMLIMFVVWGVLFLYLLVRYYHKNNPKADYVGTKTHASKYAEIVLVIVEAGLLLGFAFPLWAKRVNPELAPADAMEVRVIAQQFNWNIHYPGEDGIFGRTSPDLVDPDNGPGIDWDDPNAADDFFTVNDFHVPINKPVIVHLSSKDVIHSFDLKEMRSKLDCVPGLEQSLWFTPIITGRFEITCAQLCGIGHYRMRGLFYVDTEEDYELWVEEQLEFAAMMSGDDEYE